jgi:hypothetical protein
VAEPTEEQMLQRALGRFWPKVEDLGPNGCCVWRANLYHDGYGRFYYLREVRAHRFAWELVHGPIPSRLQVDHLCRNRACVRPSHLRLVTARENLLALGSKSLAKIRADAKHCKHGHALSGENLYLRKRRHGGRACLTCRRRIDKERAAKRKAARHAAKALRNQGTI